MYNALDSAPRMDAGVEISTWQKESIIDLHEIYAAIFRSRYVLIAIISGCLAVGVVATLMMTRQYAAEATVEVRQEAEKVLGTEQDRESAVTKADIERFLDTQVDLVRSRRVTIAVAEQLGLFRNDDFLKIMKVSLKEPSGNQTAKDALREQVVETLLDRLQVGYTGNTRILVIRFISPNAQMSASISNAYARNYILSSLQRKADTSSYARDFLRRQLREAQIRLGESERAALEYARDARIVDASNAARPAGGGGAAQSAQPQSLITAQLVQLNQAYAEAINGRVDAEQRWRRIAQIPVFNIPDVLGNPTIQELLQRRALTEAELSEQLKTRQDDYPTVVQLRARLGETNRQLSMLAGNIQQSIRSHYDIALQREKELQRQIETLKGSTLVEQNQSIQLSILRREVDTNRQQFEALLLRFNQLNAEAGVQSNNLAMVDNAVVNPEPSSPKIPLNMALALIAGLVLAAAYVLAQLRLFDKIRTSVDVTERLGLPILSVIPVSTQIIADMEDPKSPASEAINVLRTSLSLSSEAGIPKAAMVTSVQPSEGKTSSCLSLAIGFARIGKKVLLIDLDLRRPNVHRLVEVPNKIGASSVLAGQADVSAAIQKTRFAGVDVITGGPIAPSPTDLFMGQQLQGLIDRASSEYDLVLVDAPPMLALADAEILGSRVDAVVFIVESARNSRNAVNAAVTRLQRSGAHVTGVVLTKYNAGQLGYGYGSEYKYVYHYGDRNSGAE